MRKLRVPENLTALAYRQIRSHILSGDVDGGDRLTEGLIAEQLGISKSPVREAFNRLEAEGLIRIEPRRGAYLRSFSLQDVSDIYDLREAIEIHAVMTAKVSPEVLAELGRSVERSRQYHAAGDKSSYIEEDVHFHSTIATASGNVRLSSALENLQRQLRLLRAKTYGLSSSRAVESHIALVYALGEANRFQAVELMRSHIRGTRDKLIDYLSTKNSQSNRN